MKTQTKSPYKINSIIPRRWTAYMAAAAASSFAGAGSAEGEIHYSGNVLIRLTGNAQASLPLSNGASLVFENVFGGSTFIQTFQFLIKGAISGSARGYFQSIFHRAFLSNLSSREKVSAGEFFSVTGNPGHGILFTNWSDGEFAPNSGQIRGFVAFRFNTGDGAQYGWARIQTRNDNNHHVHDVIKDYAWGDPGDVIFTGQTHSSQSAGANSILGSLGLLALGAQGLDAWRAQCAQNPN